MGYELNLTNDQKRRIDGAKTPEEMNLGTFPRAEDHGNFLYHLKKRWTMSLEGGPQNFLDEYSS